MASLTRSALWFMILAVTLTRTLTLICPSPELRNPTATATEDMKELSRRNTKYAFDLFKAVSRSTGHENVMISPFISAITLSILNLAASGETKEELIRALHYEGIEDRIDSTYQDLGETFYFNPEMNRRGALKLASGVFSNDKYKINSKFVKDVETIYKGNVSELNFSQKPEEAEGFINKWVQNATNDRITSAVPEGHIDGNTVLMIINAIYLKTKWAEEFESALKRQFYLTESESVDVRMMQYVSTPLKCANVEEHGFHLVEVPLRGRQVGMYYIVPHQVAGLDDVMRSIDSDVITDVIDNKMKTLNVNLVMPEFRFSSELTLEKSLQDLGIHQLFSPSADLSKMLAEDGDSAGGQGQCEGQGQNQHCQGHQGYHVDSIRHKAFIAVDSYGVEAAATDAGEIVLGDPEYPPPDGTLVLDRPFSFFIRGHVTKTLLFMGSVYNPTQG